LTGFAVVMLVVSVFAATFRMLVVSVFATSIRMLVGSVFAASIGFCRTTAIVLCFTASIGFNFAMSVFNFVAIVFHIAIAFWTDDKSACWVEFFQSVSTFIIDYPGGEV